jgi:hypothetical protein
MARRVQGKGFVAVLALASPSGFAACVVPPPLSVDTADAGLNAPPVITEAHDSALNSLRPPATLTVNRLAATPIDLTLYDVDVDDELTIQLFVDYDHASPLDARVTCMAAPSMNDSPSRRITCTTMGLCLPADVGATQPHRLEIEVYDARPDDIAPYRTPPGDGLFSTWTLDLSCIEQPP